MTLLRRTAAVTAAISMSLTLAACVPPQSGSLVNSNQAQVAQNVTLGTVVASRSVTVQGGAPGGNFAGALGGGLVGGALGNQIGDGRGQDLARTLGAVAGAAAGNRAANRVTAQQSTEWTVRLDDGRTIAVIQSEPGFFQGQRVQVIRGAGGLTRLTPI